MKCGWVAGLPSTIKQVLIKYGGSCSNRSLSASSSDPTSELTFEFSKEVKFEEQVQSWMLEVLLYGGEINKLLLDDDSCSFACRVGVCRPDDTGWRVGVPGR